MGVLGVGAAGYGAFNYLPAEKILDAFTGSET